MINPSPPAAPPGFNSRWYSFAPCSSFSGCTASSDPVMMQLPMHIYKYSECIVKTFKQIDGECHMMYDNKSYSFTEYVHISSFIVINSKHDHLASNYKVNDLCITTYTHKSYFLLHRTAVL